MPEREVEHGALSQLAQVHHRMPRVGPALAHEAGSSPFEFGVQQHMQVRMHVGQVQLVRALERLDAAHQRVLGVCHLHAVRRNRRVRDELRAQRFHQMWRPGRCIHQSVGEEAKDRIRAV